MKVSKNWTRENLAWAGGFLEGEGCISRQGTVDRSKRYGYWALRATSTDLDSLEKLQQILGVGSIYNKKTTNSQYNRKRAWQWTVYRQPEVYATIIAVFSFLCARRRAKAKEALVEMGARGPWKRGSRTVKIGRQAGQASQEASALFFESLAAESRTRASD